MNETRIPSMNEARMLSLLEELTAQHARVVDSLITIKRRLAIHQKIIIKLQRRFSPLEDVMSSIEENTDPE